MKQHGIGVGYSFPHDFEGADVEQQYLPDELVGRRYYVPTDQGYEATIAARMAARPRPRRRKGRGQDTALEDPGPGDDPPRGRRPAQDPRDQSQETGRHRKARRRGLTAGQTTSRRIVSAAMVAKKMANAARTSRSKRSAALARSAPAMKTCGGPRRYTSAA